MAETRSTSTPAGLTHVRYEFAAPHIARIVLARPEKRNAQGRQMTHELDRAIHHACHDDDIRVIILAADGDHFSAGHDLGGGESSPPPPAERVTLWGQYGAPGWEGYYAHEKEFYLELTERWRNAPKPVIAQVQGSVIAGGLMLMWMCDIIVCSDDARFRDNTGADMGVPGVEVFNHPYELGVRKAKEFLFTGGWMSADDALRCGMVNHVVPRDRLVTKALEIALSIAKTDGFTLKLLKESVNAAQDNMGRHATKQTAFANHQMGHLHNMLVHNFPIDISRLPEAIRDKLRASKPGMTAGGPHPPSSGADDNN